jgi:rhodanese-related sulfurtransferase
MKKVWVILLFLILLTGCSNTGTKEMGKAVPNETYRTITAAEGKTLIADKNTILVDVRAQSEFDAGHIAGAILMPYDQTKELAPSLLTDKNATIVVYCRSGRRSAIAAKELAEMGYTKVYDLGGLESWPYGTVKD